MHIIPSGGSEGGAGRSRPLTRKQRILLDMIELHPGCNGLELMTEMRQRCWFVYQVLADLVILEMRGLIYAERVELPEDRVRFNYFRKW
jgi:hypothetical protein